MKEKYSLTITLISLLLFGLFIGCDESSEFIPPNNYVPGDDIISSTNGYQFDQNHSSVRWETNYLGTGSLLTGRFNEFLMEIEFDERLPENISVEAWVLLNSVNTGEPGRDEGCLLGTFGTDLTSGEVTSNMAVFQSTSSQYMPSDGGYKIVGNLTFMGITNQVEMMLYYVGKTEFAEDSGVHGAPFSLAGFIAEFEIRAKSIFGIDSDNIDDIVEIKASGNFKTP